MASINRLSEKRYRNEIFVSNDGQNTNVKSLQNGIFRSFELCHFVLGNKDFAKSIVKKIFAHKKKWDIFIKMFDFVYYWLPLCVMHCKKCLVKFICNWLVVNAKLIVSCY